MQNLYLELIEVLEKDDRLIIEGGLSKNLIVEFTLKMDEVLLETLIENENIKKTFFKKVKETLVFDKMKFVKFINNKEFLPNSFTIFQNHIGLFSNNKYSKENEEVVLAWPYKDCILEGGQDKEDIKRNEIFYSEIFAPDEIDRMLEPKVLNNIKEINTAGQTSVTEIQDKDNLIIKGNNLIALHTLKHKYTNSVKLIYIDPPYNTGSDSFGYNDKFNHSTWLTFMKNRLEAARDLLRDDGAIFIHISDHELAYLKVLCDEIFKDNFVNQITVRTKSPSGFKTVNLGVFETAEYILVYAKNKEKWLYNPQYVKSDYDQNYKLVVTNKEENCEDWVIKNIKEVVAEENGYETPNELVNALGKNVFNKLIEAYALENPHSVYRLTTINTDAGKETLDVKTLSLKEPDKFFVVSREGKEDRYVTRGQEMAFYSKKVREIDGVMSPSMLLTNIWSDIAWEGIANEGGVVLKKGKKPEKLLKRIIEMSTQQGDTVLDFFLGSGTTAAVAHKMERHYIGIEQLNYGANDSVIRLKNVINNDQTGISGLVNWQGGGSFIYAELFKLNEFYFEKIRDAEETENLKEIWEEMKTNSILNYEVDISKFDQNITAFEELSFDHQKEFLLNCLDKNALYVDYSEIDDVDYEISDEIKDVNKKFFEVK